MSQTVRSSDRKIVEIRSAARVLENEGDHNLAGLLRGVADAYEQFRADDPAFIDEALRWTPVLYSATRVAREVFQ